MIDRITEQPDRRTPSAGATLKNGMRQLLHQRGRLEFDSLVSKGCTIEVILHFKGNGREGVPTVVTNFIDSQYPDREVGLDKVVFVIIELLKRTDGIEQLEVMMFLQLELMSEIWPELLVWRQKKAIKI